MRSVEDVLAYQNDDVVLKFLQRYPFSWEDGVDIFSETKRWLWFAATNELETTSMYRPLAIVDEMWHVFVSFTVDYAAFCNEYLGRFIHHIPTTEAQKAEARLAFEADPSAALDHREAAFRRDVAEIRRLLGEPVVKKWFVDYAARFSLQTCAATALRGLDPTVSPLAVDSDEVSSSIRERGLADLSGEQLDEGLVLLARDTFKQETCMGGCGCRRCGGGGCQGCTSGVVSPKCRPR